MGSLTANKEWFLPWRTITGAELASNLFSELQVLLEGLFDKAPFPGSDPLFHRL